MPNSEEVKKKLVGIFGGSFDPIHKGHTEVILYLLKNLPFEKIVVLPCGYPSHRQVVSSPEDRFAMTAMAFKKEHRVDVDDREIKRKGLTYSIDTLRELKQDLGNQISLVWIMGQDVFSTLHEWHKWQEFINEVHLLVMTRPNSFFDNKKISKYLLNSKKTQNFEDLLNVEYTKIFPYSVTPVDISSSQIRENIKLGLDVSSMVFKEVFDHINTEGLYLE